MPKVDLILAVDEIKAPNSSVRFAFDNVCYYKLVANCTGPSLCNCNKDTALRLNNKLWAGSRHIVCLFAEYKLAMQSLRGMSWTQLIRFTIAITKTKMCISKFAKKFGDGFSHSQLPIKEPKKNKYFDKAKFCRWSSFLVFFVTSAVAWWLHPLSALPIDLINTTRR